MNQEEAAKAALLTDKDLAERWGVKPRTIQRWRAAGKTPKHIPIGHKGGFGQGVRYALEDVLAFEQAKKNGE